VAKDNRGVGVGLPQAIARETRPTSPRSVLDPTRVSYLERKTISSPGPDLRLLTMLLIYWSPTVRELYSPTREESS